MAPPQPPSLDFYSNVRVIFAYPSGDSASKLAAMINKGFGVDKGTTTGSLDALLSAISRQLLLSSFGHREYIDDYVNLIIFTALLINSGTVDAGIVVEEEGRTGCKSTVIHPTSGPVILGGNLANVLSDELRNAISRSRSPVEEWDQAKSRGYYYYKVMIHATVLARTFALTDIFRDSLWSNIEDILVKGLFSGNEFEPGVFIALTSILLGAGKEIKEYMDDQEKGSGKSWSWCDDERWGWKDVIEALKQQPEQKMADRLPEDVKDSFELAKIHVAGGKIGDSWDSKRLGSKAFNGADTDLDNLGI